MCLDSQSGLAFVEMWLVRVSEVKLWDSAYLGSRLDLEFEVTL